MAKIEDAIVDFIINNGTFYASLLSQMHRFVDNKIPTIAVNISNGRINMKYNEPWLATRNMKDTKAILEHECMHIVMEHHLRAKNRDLEKWKVATDLAINQLLPHLPADAITPDKFFEKDMYKYNIERMREAEYYYELLEKSDEAKKKMQQAQGQGKSCGCDEQFDGDGKGQGEGDTELSKEIIKGMVNEAIKSAKGQGQLPAGLEKYVEELFKPAKISWRTILRKFVANSIKSGSRPSWKKPSRRYGAAQKGRVPARTISLTVVIDTSGSIDDDALKSFMDEVNCIQKCYKSDITVLECDAEVARHYKLKKFSKLKRDVKGGGGTSFKPPFKYVKAKHIRTDALIYFTDLCGDFPTHKPPMPVLWAYYNPWSRGHDNPEVPFGMVVHIEKDKTK